MVTEEEFLKEHPSLKDNLCNGFNKYDPDTWELIHKTQLDKQKVKDVIDKIESYMIEQHTQPNCTRELARGWKQATRELEHFFKKELGLE